MAKKDKEKGNQKKFYKDLTYKQFKSVGHVPIEMNDIAWAGRLFTKYPFWFKRLTGVMFVLCLISVICLGVIWGSILLRSPALLLGVYPQGQVVCFPRLFNIRGQAVGLDEDYRQLCATLDQRAGMMWQTTNANNESSVAAVGDTEAKIEYANISDEYERLENSRRQGLDGPSLQDDLNSSGSGETL